MHCRPVASEVLPLSECCAMPSAMQYHQCVRHLDEGWAVMQCCIWAKSHLRAWISDNCEKCYSVPAAEGELDNCSPGPMLNKPSCLCTLQPGPAAAIQTKKQGMRHLVLQNGLVCGFVSLLRRCWRKAAMAIVGMKSDGTNALGFCAIRRTTRNTRL